MNGHETGLDESAVLIIENKSVQKQFELAALARDQPNSWFQFNLNLTTSSQNETINFQ